MQINVTAETQFNSFSVLIMVVLIFSIANQRHPEIIGLHRGLKRDTPEISAIIDRVLDKTPQNRYHTTEELAKDLRNCLKNIKKINDGLIN